MSEPSLPQLLEDPRRGAPGLRRAAPLAPFLEAAALFAAIGASIGFFFWAALNAELISLHVRGNSLGYLPRQPMLLSVALGAVLAPAVAWLLWVERRGGSINRLRKVAARLAPAVGFGFLPLLFQWTVWQGRELEGLVFILLTCLGLERAVRSSIEVSPCVFSPAVDERIDRARARLAASKLAAQAPLAAVVLCAIAYAVFFSIFSIHNHYRFATAAFDLGIENNLVWNAAHLNGPLFKTSPLGGPHAFHSGYHQTFISYLIAIPYRLWPTPEALLVLQATVSAAAALPIFIWLRARAGAWLAALVALAYLFYPPLHGGNLYDFHYQPFGPFFLITTLIFLERGWWRRAALFALLTMSLREDMSLMLVVAGAYLVLTRQRVAAGLILAGLCSVVFVVQKLIIMPMLLDGQAAYIHQYKGLLAVGDGGFGGVIKTVLTNPGFTLTSLLKPDKLVYVLHIFVPLALLPLRRPIGWLFCLPGFFFTLLSTEYPPLVSISFQYTAYWSMFVFLSCGWALATERGRARRVAMALALLLCTAAATWNFGGWLRSDAVHGGFRTQHFTLTEEDERRHRDAWSLIEQIPPDARVSASEYLNPQVSSRANAYSLRDGAFDADWILFEQPALLANERTGLAPLVERDEFGLVDSRGGFYLLKRGADPGRNRQVLQFLR